jgi:transmembrane 9 superfamily protein 2/4
MKGIFLLFTLAVTLFVHASAGSITMLPGVNPNAWDVDEEVSLKANKIVSTDSPVIYDYYDLPFCTKVSQKSLTTSENIGDSLSGDSVTVSPYVLNMQKDKLCAALCVKTYEKKDLLKFRELIDAEFYVHWEIDGLPVASLEEEDDEYITRGFPLGYVTEEGGEKEEKKVHHLYNHVKIIVRYSEIPEEFEGVRIVGFEVEPFSVKHAWTNPLDPGGSLTTCTANAPITGESTLLPQLVDGKEQSVLYTYDVVWVESEVRWENRYDIYLKSNPEDEIHYFSIVNSLMIVLFLTGVVAMM